MCQCAFYSKTLIYTIYCEHFWFIAAFFFFFLSHLFYQRLTKWTNEFNLSITNLILHRGSMTIKIKSIVYTNSKYMCCLQFTGSMLLLYVHMFSPQSKHLDALFLSPTIWFTVTPCKNWNFFFGSPKHRVRVCVSCQLLFFNSVANIHNPMNEFSLFHERLSQFIHSYGLFSNALFAQWNNSQIENCARFHNSGKWKVNLYAKYERIGSSVQANVGKPS